MKTYVKDSLFKEMIRKCKNYAAIPLKNNNNKQGGKNVDQDQYCLIWQGFWHKGEIIHVDFFPLILSKNFPLILIKFFGIPVKMYNYLGERLLYRLKMSNSQEKFRHCE